MLFLLSNLVTAAGRASLLVLLLLPQDEAQRRALEAEGLAELLLQIALVGEVHQGLVVDEHHEGRRLHALLGLIPIVVLFGVVLGGMFSGIFSYTEAAAIGVLLAIGYTAIVRKLTWKGFWARCLSALKSSIMVFQIMIAAGVFGYFLTVTNLPKNLAALIGGLEVPRVVILFAMLLMYIIIGMFMDTLSVVILTIPIFAPIVTSLGYDLIWFGVVIVLVMVLGTITPPIGINLFIAAGLDKNVPISGIMKSSAPYCIALLIVTILIILIPDISLWLPNLMYGVAGG